MNALVLAPFHSDALSALRERMRVTYEPWTETRKLWDPRDLAEHIQAHGIQAVVIEADFLIDDVFQEGSPLRFVGVCRSAVNHVDVDAATAHGVLVVNTPARNAAAVAEHTIGLMLALARHIPASDEYVRTGKWQDPVEPYITLRGRELAGKTLGVVGLGQVGKRMAGIARAIGMRVVATDPYAKPVRGVEMVPLDALLAQSDVVTLHAPEPADGKPMLDIGRIAAMKPSAYLINTAAPGLVDTTALVGALRAGKLAGAALDVFDSAPLPTSSPLLSLPNVVLTPHIGGATEETIERYSNMMAQDILRFLDGKRPTHLVNPQAWGKRRE